MIVRQATAFRRLCAALHRVHTPVPGVPRWAKVAAYAIPFTVLPSCLWQIATFVVGFSGDGAGELPSWSPLDGYLSSLSIQAELVALAALALIAAWGEVLPRWIPLLGGRKVPTFAAIVPAAVSAAIMTTMWTVAFTTAHSGHTTQGTPESMHGWRLVFFELTYAPLLLWGPLLAALCVAYWRRRRTPTVFPA